MAEDTPRDAGDEVVAFLTEHLDVPVSRAVPPEDRADWERFRVPMAVAFLKSFREQAQIARLEAFPMDAQGVAVAMAQIQVCEKVLQILTEEGEDEHGS